MSVRLKGPMAKVERAKHHVKELEVELSAFQYTNPYKVGTKRNPQTRQLIYYLTSVSDVPIGISVIAGEVIQSLRSALDHLAYQLVLVGIGQPGPFHYVYFPISDSAQKYEAGKTGQVQGMTQDAIDAIDALKPYQGGNDTLWRINKLNNIDKHRLLVTVGSQFRSVDLGAHMSRFMQESFPDKPIPMMSVFVKPADTLFPLKTGDELFIDGPDAEPNDKMQFRFEVALSEPQVLEGEPVLEALHQMVDLVDNLVPAFAPLL
jgi:hypothetical protein